MNIATRKDKFEYSKTNILLFLIFLYLVGPNIRIYNAYLQDFLFFIFFFFAVLTDYRHQMLKYSKVDIIFITPFLVVLITGFGKLLSGFELSWNDYAHLINMLKLFFIAKITLSIFNYNSNESIFLRYSKKTIKYLKISVIFISFIGFCQFFNIITINNLVDKIYKFEHQVGISNIEIFLKTNRITSIFKGFNSFGFFLASSLFLLFCLLIHKPNFTSGFAFLIGLFAFLLTNSRTSLLSFVFMCVVYYLISKESKKLSKGILFSIALIILLIFFGNYFIHLAGSENIHRLEEIKNFFIYGHLPYNLQVRLITASWLPKYVLSSRYYLFGFPNLAFFHNPNFTAPDNQYTAWLVSYGIVGFLLMVMWAFGVILYLIQLNIIKFKGFNFKGIVKAV